MSSETTVPEGFASERGVWMTRQSAAGVSVGVGVASCSVDVGASAGNGTTSVREQEGRMHEGDAEVWGWWSRLASGAGIT
jgi:hypothetical protein